MRFGYSSHVVCGVKMTPTTVDDLFALIDTSVTREDQVVIASLNLHAIYAMSHDPTFRSLHDHPDTCVHIDGMPLIWLGRAAGLPITAEHRTTWVDWFLPLMEQAERSNWRVFYLGGTPEVLSNGMELIRSDYPQLEIAGHHGYFDAAHHASENHAVVETINRFKPHVLIVGMGMGRQERWIVENRTRLQTNCLATCGACLEYFVGESAMAPRWMGRAGLEWAHRLAKNPKRFWRRYLIEPWRVAGYLAHGAFKNGLRRS